MEEFASSLEDIERLSERGALGGEEDDDLEDEELEDEEEPA